jgi:energy-coupling factor transporter ATP-binding protein EcfA2
MTMEEEIVQWASLKPSWQRMILRIVARGEQISPETISGLVARLIGDAPDPAEAFEVGDFPKGKSASAPVRLLELRHATNLNAIVQDTPLTFAPQGLTIVYGDNGSGKSGYARVIKKLVRARHTEQILTDIFSDIGLDDPTVEAVCQIGDQQVPVRLPHENLPDAARIGFFDEACSNLYVTSESDVTYRPTSLFVLDGLIHTCDLSRVEIERRLATNSAEQKGLPVLPADSRARAFLESLTAGTTCEDVKNACEFSAEDEAGLSRVTSEELRLRATDAPKEKQRLQKVAGSLTALADHISACDRALGIAASEDAENKCGELSVRKSAAQLASAQSFQSEPLTGVGTEAWRSLWASARRFSALSCGHDSFPPKESDARCPLCQQPVGEQGLQRLARFDAFVRDETQRHLESATLVLQGLQQRVEGFEPQSVNALRAIDDIRESYPDLAEACRATFEAYERRKAALLDAMGADVWIPPTVEAPTWPPVDFTAMAEEARRQAETIDAPAFDCALRAATSARVEYEARRNLSLAQANVAAEVTRLHARHRLEVAKIATNTQGISRKAAELAREHVTTIMRDRFTREADRLGLERVTLADVGGKKGALQHQPAFVAAIQNAPIPQVLSEGEQTALGLAGFFTEAHFDQSKSALVLDDPVSSLDHVRRARVATTLAAVAKERQVIVFSHDIAFVADIRLAATAAGVEICERSVARRPSGQPGSCSNTHPWKAKDVSQRFQQLEQHLAQIRREMNGWDTDHYERECAEWAGKLSETWERVVSSEIAGKLVDTGTQEVRPRMFRLLAQITPEDDRDFQSSYARCSRWARRHDKSTSVNYVAPQLAELTAELTLARQWFERVRKYGQ